MTIKTYDTVLADLRAARTALASANRALMGTQDPVRDHVFDAEDAVIKGINELRRRV